MAKATQVGPGAAAVSSSGSSFTTEGETSSPKYNRTPHLPWSPGGTNDDKRIDRLDNLLYVPLIFTEKMDGSNVCLESNSVYARSHSGPPSHPSFDALKALHSQIRHLIPVGVQVFGEWLYAEHSIHYTNLPHYLLLFSVRTSVGKTHGSWAEVEEMAERLGVPTVPVLMRSSSTTPKFLQVLTDECLHKPIVHGGREGIVVRTRHGFPDDEFHLSVAKWVRKDHVTTDDHWKHKDVVKNELWPRR